MSILITESYANDTTPLWTSVNSSYNNPVIVGKPVGITTTYFIPTDSGASIYIASGSTANESGASYNATLCFTIYIDPRNLPIGAFVFPITLSTANTIGGFECGYNLVYYNQSDIVYPNGIPVELILPFVSDGNNQDITCYVANNTGNDTTMDITTISESLVNTGIAVQTATIFTPT